jgi:hypothetical protein
VANLFVLFSFHFLVSSIVFLPRSPFPLWAKRKKKK